jgi:hypothetical protein
MPQKNFGDSCYDPKRQNLASRPYFGFAFQPINQSFFPVSCQSARRAEWQDSFILLCGCAQKVQNKGWQSANRSLWICRRQKDQWG